MFTLKKENNTYILGDILSNTAVSSPELRSILLIAELIRSIRADIEAGKPLTHIHIAGPSNPRAMGKNVVLALNVVKWGLEKQRAEEAAEKEVCDTCGGTGEIDEPALQRGGFVVGPDSRPCPTCQYTEPDDFSGATEGDR